MFQSPLFFKLHGNTGFWIGFIDGWCFLLFTLIPPFGRIWLLLFTKHRTSKYKLPLLVHINIIRQHLERAITSSHPGESRRTASCWTSADSACWETRDKVQQRQQQQQQQQLQEINHQQKKAPPILWFLFGFSKVADFWRIPSRKCKERPDNVDLV